MFHKHLFCTVSRKDTNKTGFLHYKKRHNESGQGSWRIPGSLWHSPGWQPGSAHHREVPFLFEPQVSHPSSRANSKCIWNGLSTWGQLEMSWGQGRADVYPLHGTMKGELGSLIWPWTTSTLGREKVKKQWRWHWTARQAIEGMPTGQARDAVFILQARCLGLWWMWPVAWWEVCRE